MRNAAFVKTVRANARATNTGCAGTVCNIDRAVLPPPTPPLKRVVGSARRRRRHPKRPPRREVHNARGLAAAPATNAADALATGTTRGTANATRPKRYAVSQVARRADGSVAAVVRPQQPSAPHRVTRPREIFHFLRGDACNAIPVAGYRCRHDDCSSRGRRPPRPA